MNMAKRPVEKYDFKAFGQAIKNARKERKESRKKVSDEMYISPRYLANIENNGQHPSLQIFFELMLRYHISVDQFLLDTQPEKDTKRRQLDALLDDMSDTGIRIVTATAKEISEVEKDVYKRQGYTIFCTGKTITFPTQCKKPGSLLKLFIFQTFNIPWLSLIHI